MHARIAKWLSLLPPSQGCILDAPDDLFYLTGLSLSKGRLWAKEGKVFLIVDGRYLEKAKKHAPCPVLRLEESPFCEERGTMAFDSSFLSYQEGLALERTYPHIQWIPTPSPLKHLRVCKDPEEQQLMQKAASLTWSGCEKVLSCLQEGVSEKELAWEFEKYCRERGADRLSFDPIIAFGENSAYPHHISGDSLLKKDQIVLLDIGAVVAGYRADMTRVFFFGKPHPRLLQLQDIVQRAKDRAVQRIRPGVAIKELDEAAREVFHEENVESLYLHSLGHGIGLQTHEFPRIRYDHPDGKILLQEGMVFTIEPGLYEAGLGGIRLEDMYLVSAEGALALSPAEKGAICSA